MATDKSRAAKEGELSLIGLAAFIAIVLLFQFVSTKAGTRAMGVSMLAGAVVQQFRGRIEYGWRGMPAAGYITGALATLLNLLLATVGLAIVVWPEVAMGIFGWDKR
jgi:hypothetical protein